MKKELTLVIDVTATSDYGDSPRFALITLYESFVAKLEQIQKVCKDNGLISAQTYDGPEWADADEYRLTCDALHVSAAGDFYFSAYPKHCDYAVETRAIKISDLRLLLTQGQADGFLVDGETAFFPANAADYLKSAYEDADEEVIEGDEVEAV